MASFEYGGLVQQVATTATAAGTTTLTNTSKQIQVFTGSSTQTVTLPDATTMSIGQKFEIYNQSSGAVTINFNGGSAFTDAGGTSYSNLAAHNSIFIKLQTNSVAAGTWAVLSPGSATSLSGTLTSGNFVNSAFTAPTVQKFTSGSGTYNLDYVFTITSGNATVGATYTNNSVTFTVYATVSAATQVVMSGSSAPLASGTLTKSTGTGDATLTFSSVRTPLYLRVRMVGGGGGGSGAGTSGAGNGTAGGNTTFGTSLLAANGGSPGMFQGNTHAAGGTASLGTGPVGIALSGGQGGGGSLNATVTASYPQPGSGGASAFGGAGGVAIAATGGSGAPNTGGGGTGGGGFSGVNNTYGGDGGGAGGFIDAIIYTPSATYSYAVGTGGSGGGSSTNGAAGGAGGSGLIIVEEFYQ